MRKPAATPRAPSPGAGVAAEWKDFNWAGGEPRPGYTAVGRILRPHALRGEVRVQPFAPDAPNIQAGRQVFIAGRRHRVVRARADRGAWILEVAGISDRTAAERLRGILLETPDAEVRRDDDESFFLHEIVGLRVVTDTGRELGTVVEVLQSGAADVYVIRGEKGEVLIPAIAEVVQKIDLPVGVMTITPISGLLDESA